MTHRLAGLSLAAALVAAPALLAQAPAKPLTIGDKAPELKVSRWVKGTSHAKLEQGKTYVVEFWATWCGPCRNTIPHLTELAKKFNGKVEFIGVSVWERGADIETKVDEFVKGMGAKMEYAVARDTADAFMATHWMQAAKQRGIPAAFVVDGTGTILWIGNPGGEELEKALGEIVAGTYDPKAAAAEVAREQAEAVAEEARRDRIQQAMKDVGPAIKAAQEAKDPAKVLALTTEALAKYPDLKETPLATQRFLALIQVDAAKAKTEFATLKPEANGLRLAVAVANQEGLDKAFYASAAALIGEAFKQPGVSPAILEHQARAHFKAGQGKEAVETQQKLVEAAKGAKAPEAFVAKAEGILKTYQESLAPKAAVEAPAKAAIKAPAKAAAKATAKTQAAK